MSMFTMLIGLPGCGKTSYAQKYAKTHNNTVILSSDDIRQELWGDANDQQNPSLVFDIMLNRTIAEIKKGHNVIYDATNLIAKTRKNTLLRLRQIIGEDLLAEAVLITCSISECKRRQGDRARKVPDEVIDRMVRQFQTPWYNEGWDAIKIVNCGKKQNIDREHWRMLGESHDNHHHTRSLEMHCAAVEGEVIRALRASSAFSEEEEKVLVEAAYQHDLGKHKTKVFHNSYGAPSDEAHYYNHENVGAYLWLSGDKNGNWSDEDFLRIALFIQWHMQPYFLRDDNGDYRTKFKEWCSKRNFDRKFYDAICLLHEADKAAH